MIQDSYTKYHYKISNNTNYITLIVTQEIENTCTNDNNNTNNTNNNRPNLKHHYLSIKTAS